MRVLTSEIVHGDFLDLLGVSLAVSLLMHATLASGVCSSGCVARAPTHHGRGNALQHRGTGAEGRSADLGGAERGRALLDALLQ